MKTEAGRVKEQLEKSASRGISVASDVTPKTPPVDCMIVQKEESHEGERFVSVLLEPSISFCIRRAPAGVRPPPQIHSHTSRLCWEVGSPPAESAGRIDADGEDRLFTTVSDELSSPSRRGLSRAQLKFL